MRRRLVALFGGSTPTSADPISALPLDRTRIDDHQLDEYGIRRLYPSLNPDTDWIADWDLTRRLTKTRQRDPYDRRTFAMGKGVLEMGDGELIFNGATPRLSIRATATAAITDPLHLQPTWMNTEFTAYARVEAWGSTEAGFTLISRTNHDEYKDNPCEAHGYYARLVFSSGLVYIKKEFRHSDLDGVVYSKAIYSSNDGKTRTSVVDFDYVERYIGIKSIVRDNPDGQSVNLQVYLDLTEGVNGGDWQLALDYDDVDLAATRPTGCQYGYTPPGLRHDQSPVLRCVSEGVRHGLSPLTWTVHSPGRVAILRSDVVNGLHWKWASVREISPIQA